MLRPVILIQFALIIINLRDYTQQQSLYFLTPSIFGDNKMGRVLQIIPQKRGLTDTIRWTETGDS